MTVSELVLDTITESFEPFQWLRQSRDTTGTGVDLAIGKQIVEAMMPNVGGIDRGKAFNSSFHNPFTGVALFRCVNHNLPC